MTDESAELIILKAIYRKLSEIKDILQIKGAVATTLADFSKTPNRVTTGKPMPETLGEYTIADKGCNRCGNKISWDNYNKETHPYPDHINPNGEIVDCPEFKSTY